MQSSSDAGTGPPGEAGGSGDSGDSCRTGTAGAWRLGPAAAALATVAAILLVLAVVAIVGAHGARQADERDEAAVAAARDVVVRLSSLSQDGVSEQIDGLLARSTGPFRAQLTGAGNLFGALAGRAQFRSQGTVTSAAFESGDGQRATVLVTTTSQVSNVATPPGQQRRYRLAVTLEWDGGAWLAADVAQVGS